MRIIPMDNCDSFEVKDDLDMNQVTLLEKVEVVVYSASAFILGYVFFVCVKVLI